MAKKNIHSYSEGQLHEIMQHHIHLQQESQRAISLAETILFWIVSGNAETYRKDFLYRTQ